MQHKTRIGAGGRVVLPAPCRRELGLKQGDELIVIVTDGAIRLLTVDQAIREARRRVRKYVAARHSLVRELIDDRRREAEHE